MRTRRKKRTGQSGTLGRTNEADELGTVRVLAGYGCLVRAFLGYCSRDALVVRPDGQRRINEKDIYFGADNATGETR